ncbi:MAG: methyl-accepting chemotaxis protein [Myxococcota bacterium]
MGLGARIQVLTVALAFVLNVVSLGVVGLSLWVQGKSGLQRDLERAKVSFDSTLAQRGEILEAGARAVAGTPLLKAALSVADDVATIQDVAEQQRRTLGTDLLILLDGEGVLRGASPPVSKENDVAQAAQLEQPGPALLDGRLYLLDAQRIEAGGQTLGFVLVGTRLDSSFMAEFQKQSGAEPVLLAGGRVQGEAMRSAGAQALIEAANSPPGLFEVEVSGTSLLVLKSTFGEGGGLFLVRNQDEEFGRFRSTLFLLLGLGVLSSAAIGVAGFFITRRLTRPLRELTEAGYRVLEHDDFGQELQVQATGEVATLASVFTHMLAKLRGLLGQIQDAATRIAVTTEQIAASSKKHEQGMVKQATAISQTSATTEELTRSSRQTVVSATSVADIADKTLTAARAGKESSHSFSTAALKAREDHQAIGQAMEALTKQVKQIGKIVEFINAVADKSDVLALNAELEGTKAGEVGRGFSLVATEMRRLAENVLKSTKEIEQIIEELREATGEATRATEAGKKGADASVALAQSMSGSLDSIVALAVATSEAASTISQATQHQQAGTEQLQEAMSEVLHISQSSLEATRQITKVTQDLSSLAQELTAVVDRFKVKPAPPSEQNSAASPAAAGTASGPASGPVRSSVV